MNADEAWELGDEAGFNDGYAGVIYDACDSTVPEDLDAQYSSGYQAGYHDGQSAYRRTLEG